jgi:predicted nucleotidyltransferase component of viral defense system
MLNLNTIDPPLYQVLSDLSELPALANFTLVGGTALALQLGHRKSDDLDFFTDRSFDIREVKSVILGYNPKVEFIAETPQGFSFTLPLSDDEEDVRKLDIYNWAVKFIRPFRETGHVRLASLEDIAAFKLDAIRHRKEKKDYVDLAVLLDRYSFMEMLGFYREKFPMNDIRLVLTEVLDKEGLDKSVDPEMLVDLSPEQAFTKVERKVKEYSQVQTEENELSEKNRWQKISEMLEKKKERERFNKGKSL